MRSSQKKKKQRNKKIKTTINDFVGEQVQVITDLNNSMVESNGEDAVQLSSPVAIVGILLGLDDTYLYMGGLETGLTHIINKSSAKIIQLVDKEDGIEDNIYKQLLSQLPEPSEGEIQ